MAFANTLGTLSTQALAVTLANPQLASIPRSSDSHVRFPKFYPSSWLQAFCRKRPTAVFSSSLAKDNQATERSEEEKQVKELSGEIKHGLAALRAVETIHEALELVDLIVRLGISRFFEPEIRKILNSTFKQWDEQYGLGDAENTVIAFRLLRLCGFPVSAGVLENLKDKNGEFSSFSRATPSKISAMLKLYKCSQTGFPSESKIMTEAEEFSKSQLQNVLSEGNPSILQPNSLKAEIRFALEYPRRFLLPGLESRSIMKQMWPGSGYKQKSLELAKLDMNAIQKLHKHERDVLEEWWDEVGVTKLPFARRGVLKSHFSVSATVFEPQFAAMRLAFTKTACIAVLVDDLFDLPTSGSDGLSRFAEAFRRWDASLLDDLPDHKLILMTLQRTTEELAAEATKAQGRDMFPFYKGLWEDLLFVFVHDAVTWRNARHVPTWEDYVKVATVSIAGILVVWSSVWLMGETITDEMLQHIGNDSRFMKLTAWVGRLSNDLATFRWEKSAGEVASAVSVYMRDHPDCKSEEEAIAAIHGIIDSGCKELEWELFKSRGVVPECLSRAALNFARTTAFVYKRADAFSFAVDGEYEDLIQDYISGSFSF